MKMFSQCSDECCVCACGEPGCIAGPADDDFYPATKDEIINRLYTNKFSSSRDYMVSYLSFMYNYEYGKEE